MFVPRISERVTTLVRTQEITRTITIQHPLLDHKGTVRIPVAIVPKGEMFDDMEIWGADDAFATTLTRSQSLGILISTLDGLVKACGQEYGDSYSTDIRDEVAQLIANGTPTKNDELMEAGRVLGRLKSVLSGAPYADLIESFADKLIRNYVIFAVRELDAYEGTQFSQPGYGQATYRLRYKDVASALPYRPRGAGRKALCTIGGAGQWAPGGYTVALYV